MDHTTLKQILVGFFSLYLVILGFLYVFGPSSPISERGLGTAQGPEIVDMFLPTPAVEEVSNNFSPKIVVDTVVPAPVVKEDSYSFKNTLLAYEALSQLEVLPEKGFKPEDNKKKPYENLKNEDGYCDRRRAYFVLYPEELFEEMTFLSDNNPDTLVRKKMLSKIGVDAMPHIGSHIAKDDKTLYEIDPSITNFYSRYVLFNSKQLGRQFSCLSQISNHVPGKIVMGKKFAMTEAAIAYAKRYETRPQCFTFEKFIPKTHLLYEKEDCENFFKALNSPEYQAAKKNQKVIYLKKAGEGVHMGAGVDPVDEAQEADLRAMYDNGKKCGKINDVFLIQKYIPNPLLINGRKFDFRSYVMIASVNPLIAYYHDGTLRVSLMQYDPNSTDKKTVLTNIALNKEIYEEARDGNGFQGMSEDELKTAQQWTFARFEQYLLDSGVVKDRSWFDTYLRPQFKKAMIHLLRFGIVSTVPSSSVYSIFGLDFMLDEDFNLWFIEANSAPGMDGFSEPVENHVLKMLKDEVEIAMGLLRSRMKRVVKFVNELIDNGSIRQAEDGTVTIRSLEMNKMIFEKITQNYFEEEFLPSPGNGFSKIIDGNYPGAGKYLGFLSEECL